MTAMTSAPQGVTAKDPEIPRTAGLVWWWAERALLKSLYESITGSRKKNKRNITVRFFDRTMLLPSPMLGLFAVS